MIDSKRTNGANAGFSNSICTRRLHTLHLVFRCYSKQKLCIIPLWIIVSLMNIALSLDTPIQSPLHINIRLYMWWLSIHPYKPHAHRYVCADDDYCWAIEIIHTVGGLHTDMYSCCTLHARICWLYRTIDKAPACSMYRDMHTGNFHYHLRNPRYFVNEQFHLNFKKYSTKHIGAKITMSTEDR